MIHQIKPAKKCPTCKKQYAPNLHNFYQSNPDNLDIICKNCRKLFSEMSHKKIQFNKLRIFWERQNRSKWYQALDSIIPGFSNFPQHLAPVPKFTYSFFLFIDKRSWLTAKNVFNHLFTIPYIQSNYDKNLKSPLFPINIGRKEQYLTYYHPDYVNSNVPIFEDDTIPIGITDVEQNVRNIYSIRRIFTPVKRCRRCSQNLQTFTYQSLDPMDISDYAQIITEHLEIKRSPLRPLCFKKSEGARDGWSQTCIDCLKPWKDQPPTNTKDKEIYNIHNMEPESIPPPDKPDLPTTDSLSPDEIDESVEEYLTDEYFS